MASELRNLAVLNQSLDLKHVELNDSTDVNYLITENCAGIEPRIRERVDRMKWLALTAQSDARLHGVDSHFGFEAMFKEDLTIEAVVAILDHIYYFKGKPNLRPRPHSLSSPRLSCVTEESATLYRYLDLEYDPWHRCLVGGPRSTPIQAFYAEGTLYIFLCPAFFVQPPMATKNQCPAVSDNVFSGDSGIFYGKYQIYIMLYQLIRFYLGDNALTIDTDPKEQLDWNTCVGLSAVDSVLNPTNLQIYVACKRYKSKASYNKYRLIRV